MTRIAPVLLLTKTREIPACSRDDQIAKQDPDED